MRFSCYVKSTGTVCIAVRSECKEVGEIVALITVYLHITIFNGAASILYNYEMNY